MWRAVELDSVAVWRAVWRGVAAGGGRCAGSRGWGRWGGLAYLKLTGANLACFLLHFSVIVTYYTRRLFYCQCYYNRRTSKKQTGPLNGPCQNRA